MSGMPNGDPEAAAAEEQDWGSMSTDKTLKCAQGPREQLMKADIICRTCVGVGKGNPLGQQDAVWFHFTALAKKIFVFSFSF